MSLPRSRLRFSRRRLAVAFAIAAAADGFSAFFAVAPLIQVAADLVTALLLFAVLGWQWALLPGLVLEAIPGVYVLPFWVLVVAGVATWGGVRPGGDEGKLRPVADERSSNGDRT